MKRNHNLVDTRNDFIIKFFIKKRIENPSLRVKEIVNELADWHLFITPRSISNVLYEKK